MSLEQVNEIFNRVVFDESDRKLHQTAYKDVKLIAECMDAAAPDGPDKTLAFRALHLALMHFGAAISRHKKYKVEKEALGITE